MVVTPALLTRRSMYPVSLAIWSTIRWRSSWEVVLPCSGIRLPCSCGIHEQGLHKGYAIDQDSQQAWPLRPASPSCAL